MVFCHFSFTEIKKEKLPIMNLIRLSFPCRNISLSFDLILPDSQLESFSGPFLIGDKRFEIRIAKIEITFGLCLFSEIYFLENHFLNFPVFVCHQKSWSTENLAWFPRKCFPGKFGRKTLSGSCEKFRNIILFADYIKFGPQTFDCYIYIFCFEYLFSISFLKI